MRAIKHGTVIALLTATACTAATIAALPAAATTTTTTTSTSTSTTSDSRVYVGKTSFPVAGTNVSREAADLVVYTRTSSQTVTPTNQWGVEVAVVGGTVTAVSDRQRTGAGPLQIPVGGVVLSGHGTARDWLLAHAPAKTAGVSGPGSLSRAFSGASSYAVTGTNVSRPADGLVIYTRTGSQLVTPTNQWGAEAVLVDGKVTALVDRQRLASGPVSIPAGGAVLSGHGTARTWLLQYAKAGSAVAGPGIIPFTPVQTAPAPTSAPSSTTSPAPAPVAVSEPTPTATIAPTPTPTATIAPTPTPTATVAPTPTATATVAPTAAVAPYFSDDFEGAALSPYVSPTLNATNPKWFAEGSTDPVHRTGGLGVKNGSTQFFRMWTQNSVGGPGKSIRIKAKIRTNSIYVRDTGGIVEGTKMWLKWADTRDEAYPGPASVRGIVDGTSPGSYIYSFHTHNGYSEIMKRAPGQETSTAYTFFKNIRAPYTLGTWEDVEMTFEWLPSALRIRSYRNGVLQMEATDTSSARMMIPGYAGLRSDDSKFEIADFKVEAF